MAGETEFGDDPLAPGCYSQLLFGDEIETDGCFGFTSSFSSDDNNQNSILNSPKMLCFGDYAKQCGGNAKKTDQKPGFTCMDPSPRIVNTKKRNGSGTHNAAGNQRTSKKAKSENSSGGGGGGGHAKGVKKEKLGERITALQQLVSPFGKTDTASVLHEALGYIRFLHDQVQVLCSPYLHRSSSHTSLTVGDDVDSKKSETSKDDLRSRGLCLVPVDLTLHVADSNGADLWSSAPIVNSVPSN